MAYRGKIPPINKTGEIQSASFSFLLNNDLFCLMEILPATCIINNLLVKSPGAAAKSMPNGFLVY